METDWSQENNELSVKQSSERQDKELTETQSSLGEHQTKTIKDTSKDVQPQFSDAEIENVVLDHADWYRSLKDSSINT